MFKRSAIVRSFVVLIAGFLVVPGIWADEVAEPDYPTLNLGSLVNQFGEPYKGVGGGALVMLVAGMKVKDMVRETLAEVDPGCLQDGRVIYLANISGMPKLVSKLIAVPRLRDLSYPVWLDYSGEVTSGLPFHKGQVTLLSLGESHKVTEVSFTDTQAILNEQLLARCEAKAENPTD